MYLCSQFGKVFKRSYFDFFDTYKYLFFIYLYRKTKIEKAT
ncbi:hypothetical protein CAPGI0001_0936 [Capnocytophaga gingivalis ATCC 33624]|nr:hypothetical protein CAPGI0001_0936 [Capnocytophaga gingivalis ATCC 33624]